MERLVAQLHDASVTAAQIADADDAQQQRAPNSSVVSQQSTDAGDGVPVPQVVASYAAYLRTRTQTEPEVSVAGSRTAQVSLSSKDKTLTLTFGCHKGEWSLESAEIRRSEQTTTFKHRELAN